MSGSARPRDAANIMGRAGNITSTGVLPAVERAARARQVKRRPGPGDGTTPHQDASFCMFGEVDYSQSPRWSHPNQGARVVAVIAQVRVAGYDPTDIQLVKNGAITLASLTIGAGSNRADTTIIGTGASLNPEDYLQVVVEQSSGAEDLTVQAWFDTAPQLPGRTS